VARLNDCPWNEWICACAAEYGHLEVLKWAIENGCTWDDELYYSAAENGHLEVLKWAIDYDSYCDLNTCIRLAKQNNKTEVVDWIEKYMVAS
jgi:hypothetical protein